jgi:anti-sigma factor RsiW
MKCSDIHILLAGLVDGELTAEERAAVEAHVAKCGACRKLAKSQREAAAAYAKYPVEKLTEQEWQAVWRKVGSRLPTGAKRVSLESLREMDFAGEFLPDVEEAPAARPAVQPGGAWPAQFTGQPVRLDMDNEEPLFKPTRMRRSRRLALAHLAGPAVAALILLLVWLSVKPVIHTSQLASVGQMELEVGAGSNPPVVMMLRSSDGENIPLVWVTEKNEGAADEGSQEVGP